jgi:DNA segregation ATPase FtsK/SpoIIIE-like protein
VTSFIRENNESGIPDENLGSPHDFKLDENPHTNGIDEGAGEINFDKFVKEDSDDELFEEAVKVVREAKKASASLLQRRLAVGYARAARLIDIMEEKGIVGPGDGAKPREVYGLDATNFSDESIDKGEDKI